MVQYVIPPLAKGQCCYLDPATRIRCPQTAYADVLVTLHDGSQLGARVCDVHFAKGHNGFTRRCTQVSLIVGGVELGW